MVFCIQWELRRPAYPVESTRWNDCIKEDREKHRSRLLKSLGYKKSSQNNLHVLIMFHELYVSVAEIVEFIAEEQYTCKLLYFVAALKLIF